MRALPAPARLLPTVRAAVTAYTGHFGPQMAAAISYHVLFSLFPLAIFLVGVFGIVVRDDDRRERLVDWLLDRLPLSDAAGPSLDAAVSGLATPASLAGLVALVGVLWSASAMMGAMRAALAAVWAPELRRRYVRGKAFDLVLVVLAGLLVLVAFALTLVVRLIGRLSEEIAGWLEPVKDVVSVAGALTETLIPLVLLFATILLLYRYVPPIRPPLAHLWLPALLATIALQATATGYAYYLERFADYNLVYGSLGALVGFLFLVYLAASVFLVGAELAAVWSREERPQEAR
ncbi:MAG TPA: YihY/virulence factor BrkB family protein [Gaiellaceae bacterium]|nr:YihY/virulence factor BrkB family protein [Gaiellaceae bacterium]